MINSIEDIRKLSEKYRDIIKSSSVEPVLPKRKINISLFNKDSKFLNELERQINYNYYMSYDSYINVFLNCIKYSLEDEDFNIDFFLKDDSRCHKLRYFLITNGCYKDIRIFDNLIEDENKDIRYYVVTRCSVDKLNIFLKDKDKLIRLKAYERLGPVSHYKKSLKDRTKKIREWGINYAPIYDKSLSSMHSERSAHNYCILIQKVDKSDLPFFLSPSFLKSKTVGQYVKNRIKQEIKKRLS